MYLPKYLSNKREIASVREIYLVPCETKGKGSVIFSCMCCGWRGADGGVPMKGNVQYLYPSFR